MPAPEELLNAALHEVRNLTIGRGQEFDNDKAGLAEIAIWLRRMADYPADVAVSCLRDWPNKSKFWPTWNEFQEDVARAMSQRNILKHTILKMIRLAPSAEHVEAMRPESDEHRAKVVAECMARYREGAVVAGSGPMSEARHYTKPELAAEHEEQRRRQGEARLQALKEKYAANPLPDLDEKLVEETQHAIVQGMDR